MQAKERGNTQFKIILTQNLCDGVRPILEWFEHPVGACEVLFLQMKPHLTTNLKLGWNPMLIMSLFVLGIGFIWDIMNLLLNVIYFFKKN
jgi:hypothetical protein